MHCVVMNLSNRYSQFGALNLSIKVRPVRHSPGGIKKARKYNSTPEKR